MIIGKEYSTVYIHITQCSIPKIRVLSLDLRKYSLSLVRTCLVSPSHLPRGHKSLRYCTLPTCQGDTGTSGTVPLPPAQGKQEPSGTVPFHLPRGHKSLRYCTLPTCPGETRAFRDCTLPTCPGETRPLGTAPCHLLNGLKTLRVQLLQPPLMRQTWENYF